MVTPGQGRQVVIDRLVDLLLVHSFRAFRRIDERAEAPWVVGAMSPTLGPSLACIHRAPEKQGTVSALAREAGMSRSAFSNAFRAAIGRSPGVYLADLAHVGRDTPAEGDHPGHDPHRRRLRLREPLRLLDGVQAAYRGIAYVVPALVAATRCLGHRCWQTGGVACIARAVPTARLTAFRCCA